MRNKMAKQMIVDSLLKGRKAIWYGEETEIFACNSVNQCHDEFSLSSDDECHGGIAWSHWKGWWSPCIFELGIDERKGKPVINTNGGVNEYREILPIICGVHGDADEIAIVSTAYN